MKKYSILFIVVYNVLSAIILILNKYEFINLDNIWIDLIFNLLFIWNIILLYFLIKKGQKI